MELVRPGLHMLHAAPAKPDLAATVQHMAGVLWYEMLSELNQSGLDADALGTGGNDFQGMFLWNVAQNDFGKYDSGLTAAALRQVGGHAALAPAAPEAVSEFPAPLMLDALADSGDAGAVAQTEAVSAARDATPSSGSLLQKAKTFAQAIWPQVSAAAQTLGVPAVAVLAQTALETGWGAAAPGNNLFGIKGVDGQAGTARATHEMIDGVLTPQISSFRDYASTADAISDYVSQILSGFPNVAGQQTVSGFASALQQGGYATDTGYAAKITGIAQSPLMTAVLQSLGATSNTSGGSP